jgi:hypothetical protein
MASEHRVFREVREPTRDQGNASHHVITGAASGDPRQLLQVIDHDHEMPGGWVPVADRHQGGADYLECGPSGGGIGCLANWLAVRISLLVRKYEAGL